VEAELRRRRGWVAARGSRVISGVLLEWGTAPKQEREMFDLAGDRLEEFYNSGQIESRRDEGEPVSGSSGLVRVGRTDSSVAL